MWPVMHRLRRATTFLFRERRGGKRELRFSALAVPFVSRRRRSKESSNWFAKLVWLGLPGALLLPLRLANTGRYVGFARTMHEGSFDIVDAFVFGIALALAVRAFFAPTHWAIRAPAVLLSLSYPLYVVFS